MPKNDELLCRAKQKGTDEWVEGYYCKYERTNPDGSVNTTHMIVPYYASALYGIEIDPETVGRCTGLADKNGMKIFNGDIVTGFFNHEKIIGHIFYGSDASYFIQREGLFGVGLNNASDWIEVIGNIHDNPELIENHGD